MPTTNIDTLAALTRPIEQDDIEWVKKRGGRVYAYVTAQALRRRLDAVFPLSWDFTCVKVDDEMKERVRGEGGAWVWDHAEERYAVRGVLTVRYDVGTGVHSIVRESMGQGTDWKSAETDAFKRAAQRLGIGNELYEMESRNAPPSEAERAAAAPRTTPAAGTATAAAAGTRSSGAPRGATMPFGKTKGKLIADCGDADLESAVRWARGDEERAAKYAEFISAGIAEMAARAERGVTDDDDRLPY